MFVTMNPFEHPSSRAAPSSKIEPGFLLFDHNVSKRNDETRATFIALAECRDGS
jgi:hypothetical protein